MKYFIDKNTDAYYNLALEEWVFDKRKDDDYFFLWRNDKAIIVGRNQNTLAEINQPVVEDLGIKVVRRMSGGGAVYHDLGNVNFSFFSSVDSASNISFDSLSQPIVRAINNLGVGAKISGRNDIVIGDKKCAGLSQRISGDRVLTNGAILFDTDLSVLTKALKVHEEKFTSKGVKSVRSKVTNIRDHLPVDMDVDSFMAHLQIEVLTEFTEVCEYKFAAGEIEEIKALAKNKYETFRWNYGKSFESSYANSRYFPGVGLVEVRADISEGKISNLKIYGDFFGKADKSKLEEVLRGVNFRPADLKNRLASIDLTAYIKGISQDDFIGLLFEIS